MQVTVEDVNSVKKILHIEVPQDEVTRELDDAYKSLKKNAKVKGFRPGKTPRSVLERLYKKDVQADVSSKLIQSSFMDAVKETDLQVVGPPQIEPPDLDAKTPYKYQATIEITPALGDIDFKGLTLNKTLYKPSDEEVEAQLKAIQKNMAQQKALEEDRPAREGDFVLIDYEGFKGGQPFEHTQKTDNYTLKVGDAQIHKDFDDQLIGLRAGDERDVSVNFPEDYFNDRLAGQEIVFKVNLNQIREEILPDIDDELARRLGDFTSLQDVKDKILENLQSGYDKRTEQEVNEQIFQALLDRTEFEVPETLVIGELEGIIEELERSFMYQNTSMEEQGLTREGISEKYRETAENQVRRHLILSRLIEQENLALSDEALDEGYREMAQNFHQPIEDVQKYYRQNPDKVELFKHTLLEKQVIRLIVDNSIVNEVEPEPPQPSEEAPQG